MTGKNEELDGSSKNIPALEDSILNSSDNGGGGDRSAISSTPAAKEVSDKPVRPKNFKPLTPNEDKLIKYCEEGKIDDVRALLRNKKIKIDCLDNSGTTPLEHACYRGNLELVELLLAAGADVNNNMQVQGYTALMFAALAGKIDVVKTLLMHGARTSATNSIGKNAAQLSGFVGNHGIAVIISNFFTVEDLDYYTVPQGLEKEGKLPTAVAPTLHRYIMQTNLHPVKIIHFIRSNSIILEESSKILRTMDAIIEKEVKSREMNEIMAMKIHYFSEVIRHVSKMSHEGKSFEEMIKLFVRGRNSKGFPEYLEEFLRRSIRSFPYHQTPLHTTMVHAIAKANLGGSSGSISILEQSINGQHMPSRDGQPCDTCFEPDVGKKCSSCKMVSYCNEECQKMHWPIHKKECATLAEQFIIMEKRKADEASSTIKEEKELLNRRTEGDKENEFTGEDILKADSLGVDAVPSDNFHSTLANSPINVDDIGIAVKVDDDNIAYDASEKTSLLS